MNINIFRWRRLVAAIALLMLTCGMPSRAWCGSANLWVSFYGGLIESYSSGQLKKSGMPTPVNLTVGSVAGIAFDESNNLWVMDGDVIERFTAKQLKKLKKDSSPTPGVSITSTSTFVGPTGLAFDHQGNLWVTDDENESIDELSKAQLNAGSGNVTPAIVITSSDLDTPDFLTFDGDGNAWVENQGSSKIVEFSASQLTSGGSKSPSVVEFAPSQLASSGDPTPTVTLSSASFVGPWALAFDSKGDLVVVEYDNGTIAKFTPKQLKASGAPVPTVSVTGTTGNAQITFGPAS